MLCMQSQWFKILLNSTKGLSLFIPLVPVLSHAKCLSIPWHVGKSVGVCPFSKDSSSFWAMGRFFSLCFFSLSSWPILSLSQLHRSPARAKFMVGQNRRLGYAASAQFPEVPVFCA